MLKKYFRSKEERQQRKIQKERCKSWFAVNGDETLRLDYDLSASSLVLDVGGFKGDFAEKIFTKYSCKIFVFEPVLSFYNIIKNKFKEIDAIKIFPFGLSDRNKKLLISDSGDGSSVFLKTKNSQEIALKSLKEFIKEHHITKVDLIKINIEGGEYELLESLLESDLILMFNNLQIQFHEFIIEKARERMEKIQEKLSKTHKLTYQYEFVWENWELIK